MNRLLLMIVCCAAVYWAAAQQTIPFELFAGHKRTGADVLWFKNPTQHKNAPWLFFHRSRASVDYSNQTAFGITNAISYNFKNGIGIVAATQFQQTGFVAKGGVQLFRSFKNGSVFSWIVVGNNTAHRFSGDWFVLARYTPKLNNQIRWFIQTEFFNTLDNQQHKSYTQRLRLGIKLKDWQTGLGGDYTQSGIHHLTATQNTGIFIRKEF